VKLLDDNVANVKIIREVSALSRLSHRHIVRYYQSWIEPMFKDQLDHSDSSLEDSSSSEVGSPREGDSDERDILELSGGEFIAPVPEVDCDSSPLPETEKELYYLFIQMEFCHQTLKGLLDNGSFWKYSEKQIWQLSRQMTEAIEYLHDIDCIHRDLKPGNIFILNDEIQLGDFGLATGGVVARREESMLNLELALRPAAQSAIRTPSNRSIRIYDTGDFGTVLYQSPESHIKKRVQCSNKVDLFSLGVVLFEMWNPFNTTMERIQTLNRIREKGILPTHFVKSHPLQAETISHLVRHDPTLRPTAKQLLQQLDAIEMQQNGKQPTSLLNAENEALKQEIELLKKKVVTLELNMKSLETEKQDQQQQITFLKNRLLLYDK